MGRLATLVLVALLVSCGGGGGGGSPAPQQPEWAGSWSGVVSPLSLGLFLLGGPENVELDLRLVEVGRVAGQLRGANRVGSWWIDLAGTETWRPGSDYLLELAGTSAGTAPALDGAQVVVLLSWSLLREEFAGEIDAHGVRGAARLEVDR